jgi:hypothetical protein
LNACELDPAIAGPGGCVDFKDLDAGRGFPADGIHHASDGFGFHRGLIFSSRFQRKNHLAVAPGAKAELLI